MGVLFGFDTLCFLMESLSFCLTCFFDFKNKSWNSENKRKFTFYLSSRDKIQRR